MLVNFYMQVPVALSDCWIYKRYTNKLIYLFIYSVWILHCSLPRK